MIDVDPATRSVRIRDNGVGLRWSTFTRRLTALGASAKRGTSARGFRGVGRLAGLGYVQELIFRSRTDGESLVSELRWDGRSLRSAFRDADSSGGLADLIGRVVTARRVDAGGYPDRFFEVELKGIVRVRSDKLMSPAAIAEYLAQVAPVPFSPEFKLGDEINAALSGVVELADLEVRITGLEQPVYRPYLDSFIDDNRVSSFGEVEIIKVPGMEGELAAIAWLLHHDYDGTIPSGSLVKGLRLRCGNVQVGGNTLLEDLFPEPRFNGWSVGEVHVVDRRIVPNGRRDNFEQNAHFNNLLNHLTPTARKITRLCRTNSIRRRWRREFELHQEAVIEKLSVLAQGSLGAAGRAKIAVSADQELSAMHKIAGMEVLGDDGPEMLVQKIEGLRAELKRSIDESGSETSPLGALPVRKRKMYEHFFELVYECSANRVAAKALVDRMLKKLSEPVNNSARSR
jgi:molecular chaperone HtpG